MARDNEKGRVERATRYVFDAFFAARTFKDIDDLNARAEAWCNDVAADRRCPGEPDRTVREVFAQERSRLLVLPDNPAPLLEQVAVSVGKTPYVRFDLNEYSVPHTYVRRTLIALADPHRVRIVEGATVRARHQRSYDKGAQIEDHPTHIKALADDKRAARQHRGNDRLAQAVPASQALLARAAERGAISAGLLKLLDCYDAGAVQAAVLEVMARNTPHPNAVRLALERQRGQQGEAPPVAVVLPDHVRERDKTVRRTYDKLKDPADD